MKRMCLMLMTFLVVVSPLFGQMKEHWRLNEGAGTTAYNSIGYKTGVLEGSTFAWQAGEGMGGSLRFGRDDRVKMPVIHINDNWTAMGWIKPDSQTEIKFARLMVTSHTSGFYLGLNNQNPQKWCLLLNLSYGGATLTGPAYTPNVWQHVAATYDSATQKAYLYVNGVEVATNLNAIPAPAPRNPDQVVYIGTDRASGSPAILGVYDEFAIFDETLTAARINSIYQNGLLGKSFNDWQAKNPSPAIGAVGQPTNVAMSWTPGTNPPSAITNHILYYGTSPTAVFDSNMPPLATVGDTVRVTLPAGTTSYAPGFQSDKTIYWRVDEKAGDPNARGAIWTFETIKQTPIITDQPDNLRIFAGDTATFTVAATSPSGMTYQWYKVGTGIISGATSSVLTINSVAAANEGQYYVDITNAAGTVSSDLAFLKLKKLLGRWPLDGNADDVSGYANHGTINGATFVEGRVGSGAARFTAASSSYIDIPNESHFDTYDAFTMSIFMKGTESGQASWATMFAKGGNNGGMYINRYVTTPYASAHIDINPELTNGDTQVFIGFASVLDNAWHMFTFTFDGAQESMYVDGELVQQGPSLPPVANDIPISIGSFRNQAGPATYYDGLVDDARIYNYALDELEVAQLYYDSVGSPACITPPAGDFNGDCVADMLDLASLASGWLDCNLYPAGCP